MLWTGHSGPYHDHFVNGKQVAAQLIASGQVSVELPCAVDETEPCENVFADPNLKSKYDVVLVNAKKNTKKTHFATPCGYDKKRDTTFVACGCAGTSACVLGNAIA